MDHKLIFLFFSCCIASVLYIYNSEPCEIQSIDANKTIILNAGCSAVVRTHNGYVRCRISLFNTTDPVKINAFVENNPYRFFFRFESGTVVKIDSKGVEYYIRPGYGIHNRGTHNDNRVELTCLHFC
jgi:hypothetical protein